MACGRTAGLANGRRATHAGVAAEKCALLLAKTGKGLLVDVLGVDVELAGFEGLIHHEAYERPANQGVALLVGGLGDKFAKFVVNALVERAHERVVLGRHQHRVESGCGIHAIYAVRLALHLAGGMLCELLERERLCIALWGRLEDRANSALKITEKAHLNPRLPGPRLKDLSGRFLHTKTHSRIQQGHSRPIYGQTNIR